MCGTIASSNNPLINSLISQRNTKEENLLEKRKELFKEVVGQKNYGISVTKKTAPVPIYVPTC